MASSQRLIVGISGASGIIADMVLKERRRLVLMVWETPLHAIF